MIWIIGKKVNQSGYTEGYNLYSENDNRIVLLSRRETYKIVRDTHKGTNLGAIIGLKIKSSRFEQIARNSKGEPIVVETKGSYYTGGVDRVDDLGKPLENTGIWCMLGWQGFGQHRQYKAVNGYGDVRWIPSDEAMELAEKHKFIGLTLQGGGCHIYERCDRQYIDQQSVNN